MRAHQAFRTRASPESASLRWAWFPRRVPKDSFGAEVSEMDLPPLSLPTVRCLTKQEAAQYLGIGTTLLEQLRIPAVHFGRRCLYDRVDLDAWLEDYKRQGRAGKETQWPVKQESIDVATPVTGGFQQHYRTAGAYAKALGLKIEAKPKPSSAS